MRARESERASRGVFLIDHFVERLHFLVVLSLSLVFQLLLLFVFLIHVITIFTQASNFGPAGWRVRPPRPKAALAHPRSGCRPSADSVDICLMNGRWTIYRPLALTGNTTATGSGCRGYNRVLYCVCV